MDAKAIEVVQPQTNECKKPLEAGEGKERTLPQTLQKEHSPADAMILAP